jgi:hypothetical protein
MAIALFQHDRLTTLGTEVMQREIDTVFRKFPSLGLSEHFFHGHKQAVVEKELQQFVARGQKQHLSAFKSFHKTLLLVQKHSPMQPPEPVDITADVRQIREDDPAPEVVEEVLAQADRAKIEPSFPLPEYVLTVLANKNLMARIAPDYDPGDLLKRRGVTPFPKAA